jgi:RNA polymerase sigma factor (sigma-70 family)
MAAGQMDKLVEYIRRVASKQDAAGRLDGDLVKRYVTRHDEAAFETLVRRHGPMVLGVCRRVLRNQHDAEDAFQATFLVLVRKAATLRSPAMIGNWLFGVAHRTAWHARKCAAKRRAKEAEVIAPTEMPDHAWADLRPVLDEELARLADKYRTLLVLCDLEGRTRKEAAALLGIPEGTVATRLTQARAMLAKRLTKRGLALSAGSLAGALSAECATASVPPTLLITTYKAAAAFAAGQVAAIPVSVLTLSEGVLKMMLLGKLKNMTIVLLTVGFLSVGGGGVAYQVVGGEQGTDKPGNAVKVDQQAKGGQPPEKNLPQVSDRLAQLQSEQEALKFRVAQLEQELKQRPQKKGAASTKSADSKDVRRAFSVAGLDSSAADGENNGQHLIRVLTQTIEPQSWISQGGTGAIEYLADSHSIVVRNTMDVLFQVAQLLDELLEHKRNPAILGDKTDKDRLIQKVYSVADLGGDGDALVQVIVKTIEPKSWQRGQDPGIGLINYFPDGKSLVIVQSPEIHAKVVALLADLRAATAKQEKKK